jgi:hypothetical protein
VEEKEVYKLLIGFINFFLYLYIMIIIIFILIIFVLFLLYKNFVEEKEKIFINNYDASYPIRPYYWYEWENWYPYRTNYYYSTYKYRNHNRNRKYRHRKLRPINGPNGPIRYKKSISIYSSSDKPPVKRKSYSTSKKNQNEKIKKRKIKI